MIYLLDAKTGACSNTLATFLIGFSTSFIASIAYAIYTKGNKILFQGVIRFISNRLDKVADIDISGLWEAENPDAKYRETLTLKRTGHRLSGTIIYVNFSNPERHDTKEFMVEGRFRQKVLTLIYWAKDNRSISAGCLFAELVGDEIMKCHCVYIDQPEKNVKMDPYEMKRRPLISHS